MVTVVEMCNVAVRFKYTLTFLKADAIHSFLFSHKLQGVIYFTCTEGNGISTDGNGNAFLICP